MGLNLDKKVNFPSISLKWGGNEWLPGGTEIILHIVGVDNKTSYRC